MRTLLCLLCMAILSASCATVITRKSHEMRITTNAKDAKAEILDSTYHLPTKIRIKRSKNDLDIKLISDTATLNYTLKSSVNPAFLYGNLFWVQAAPAAYLIDMTNHKRFYYGSSVFLDISDSVRVIRPPLSKSFHEHFSKSHPTHKGELYDTYYIVRFGNSFIGNNFINYFQEVQTDRT